MDGYSASNVLYRQKGWREPHDTAFYETASVPYEFGCNEWEEPFSSKGHLNPERVHSVWKSGGGKSAEWSRREGTASKAEKGMGQRERLKKKCRMEWARDGEKDGKSSKG